jgi:hypothetical protein
VIRVTNQVPVLKKDKKVMGVGEAFLEILSDPDADQPDPVCSNPKVVLRVEGKAYTVDSDDLIAAVLNARQVGHRHVEGEMDDEEDSSWMS